MIEKILKNEESLKKWQAFKNRKPAIISIWLIVISCFFSFTAEFWANSKPLIISYKGNTYFPVLKDYSVKEFGITDSMSINYKQLQLDKNDWVLWPFVK